MNRTAKYLVRSAICVVVGTLVAVTTMHWFDTFNGGLFAGIVIATVVWPFIEFVAP